ncbi:MAG: hypothetical protein AAFR38_06920 [Planctomycetota bacterium]
MTRTLLIVCVGLSLVGCAGQKNDRPVLGGRVVVPALDTGSEGAPLTDPEDWGGPGEATTTVSRAGWSRQEFLVPVDGTAHGPTWATRLVLADGRIERSGGLYPSPESALDLKTNARAAASEGIVTPMIALGDVALMPVRLFVSPLWGEQRSPRVVYKRWRQGTYRVGEPAIAPDAESQTPADTDG